MIIPKLGIIIPIMSTKKLRMQDVLFSKVQQRILAILFGQPDKHLYTNEIIRLSHIGTGAIQRELAKLSAAELIVIKEIGNQKHYQANAANPIFSELRSIVLKTFGLADVLKETLSPLAHQISISFIYGSIAKQEDSTHSDIDLMITSDDLTYADLFPLLERAEVTLARHINPTCYSISEWICKRKRNNHFLNQVMKQPKIFLIGTEDEIKKFG